jgi:hypothetical protein
MGLYTKMCIEKFRELSGKLSEKSYANQQPRLIGILIRFRD